MKTIFLTGATGVMGWSGMCEILKYPNKYRLRILARPSATNVRKLTPYLSRIEVIWGDLMNFKDVLRGVSGSDIVLHVGGMVSPKADYAPTLTRNINLTAAKNIRDAVLQQTNQPKVVYIGSVAQMGDRREPLHWGRAGDPICVSAYDHYGITKCLAERIITDSPIKCWVSLRQSGILYPAILNNFDPIMFHVPIRGVLEWATVEDSGRLLERVCCDEVPDDFWKRYYNIGSGAEYRISNYEFECLLLEAIGCPPPESIFEPKWFALRNFHGMWYSDSDVLESILHFRRNIPVKTYFKQLADSPTLPIGIKFAKLTHIAKLFPHVIKFVMYCLSLSKEHGTQWWIKNRVEQRIRAYYGSMDAYRQIPSWAAIDRSHNSADAIRLNHGYDETKPLSELDLTDMQQAAIYRGGKCLETSMQRGDLDSPLLWECACGHQFHSSPRVILLGGHWCPECFPYPYKSAESRPWNCDAEAKRNPFFAQIWRPLHGKDENNSYGADIFENWEK